MVKAHTFSIGLIIAIVTSLLLPAAWAQEPKLAVRYGGMGGGCHRPGSPSLHGIQAYFVVGNCLIVSSPSMLSSTMSLTWRSLGRPGRRKVYVFHLRQG